MERAAFFSAWRDRQAQGRGVRRARRRRATRPRGSSHRRRQGRPLRRGRAARGAGPLRAPGPRARPQEARGDAAPDPAHPPRREIFAPIWENGFIRGVGPRVEEPALTLIPSFPYSAPYEDVRLKPLRRRPHALHADLRRLPHRHAAGSRPDLFTANASAAHARPDAVRRRRPGRPAVDLQERRVVRPGRRRGPGGREVVPGPELPRRQDGRDRPLRGRQEGHPPADRSAPAHQGHGARRRAGRGDLRHPRRRHAAERSRGGRGDVPHLQRLAEGLLPALSRAADRPGVPALRRHRRRREGGPSRGQDGPARASSSRARGTWSRCGIRCGSRSGRPSTR